jgi:hypothetical protein
MQLKDGIIECGDYAVEGWHHGFLSMIGARHPQIFTFIEYIRKEKSMTDLQKKSTCSWRSKSTYVRCSRRIQSLIHQYKTLSRLHFDKAIQLNLTLSVVVYIVNSA